MKKLELITTSPMVDVSNIQVIKKDVRYLNDEELEKISTKLDEISGFVKNRTFFSSLDMDYVQKNVRDK